MFQEKYINDQTEIANTFNDTFFKYQPKLNEKHNTKNQSHFLPETH